jgi:adenylate kinase
MRLVLLGAPGSGKGTQSALLVKAYGVPQISTGDLLREARAKGTELGLRAKAAMDAGKLVDDDTVLGMIRERLSRPDAINGFILDGFPRNIAQADALQKMLADLDTPLEAVVLLNLDLKILFKRLTGRRICETCNQVFNIYTSPPGMLIEKCGDKPHRLIQRDDDKEEVIGKRLDVYEAQTKPLISHYREAGLLRVVDADADTATVFKNIQQALGSPASASR